MATTTTVVWPGHEVYNLGILDGTDGFRVTGESSAGRLGYSVSDAGVSICNIDRNFIRIFSINSHDTRSSLHAFARPPLRGAFEQLGFLCWIAGGDHVVRCVLLVKRRPREVVTVYPINPACPRCSLCYVGIRLRALLSERSY